MSAWSSSCSSLIVEQEHVTTFVVETVTVKSPVFQGADSYCQQTAEKPVNCIIGGIPTKLWEGIRSFILGSFLSQNLSASIYSSVQV